MTKISTQFLFRISVQQFVVATAGRRGSSIASQTKAITWNGNMKSKKHVQSRKELECKEFGMIQARQQKPKNYVVLKQQSAWTLTNPEIRGKDNGQSRKKQERTDYTLTRSYGPSQRARRERKRTKQKVLHSGMEDFICSSSFIDIETFYAGK